jgi:hypothetical protein
VYITICLAESPRRRVTLSMPLWEHQVSQTKNILCESTRRLLWRWGNQTPSKTEYLYRTPIYRALYARTLTFKCFLTTFSHVHDLRSSLRLTRDGGWVLKLVLSGYDLLTCSSTET